MFSHLVILVHLAVNILWSPVGASYSNDNNQFALLFPDNQQNVVMLFPYQFAIVKIEMPLLAGGPCCTFVCICRNGTQVSPWRTGTSYGGYFCVLPFFHACQWSSCKMLLLLVDYIYPISLVWLISQFDEGKYENVIWAKVKEPKGYTRKNETEWEGSETL